MRFADPRFCLAKGGCVTGTYSWTTLGDMAIGGEPESMNPSAYHVGLASLDAFRTGKFAGSHLSPHYVQRSDAEVQWDLKTRHASP